MFMPSSWAQAPVDSPLPRASRRRASGCSCWNATTSLAAIAEALGVDVGTVKTHLHRGVQKVRQAAEEAMP